jgi:hypothetical protein
MSGSTHGWIVITTAQGLVGLVALRALADAKYGPFPIYPTNNVTGEVDERFPTLHFISHIQHPTVPTTYAVNIPVAAEAWVAGMIAACAAKVTAGTATAAETAIASLPAEVSALDASWNG